MPGRLLAGAQRTTITPPVGVDLCGFAGREGPSAGVHDDLRACALFLSDGDRDLVVITADLIGLHHAEVAQVRGGLEERIGVPPEAVMIACSHTHSGPATRCINCLGEQDDDYLRDLLGKLVDVAAGARDAAAPAQAGAVRRPARVGVNRREMREERIVLGVNEAGVTAPHVDCLYVDDAEGRPVARLFCHAAHAVTLGGDNRLISGDWPGQAQRAVEEHYGPACVALFMQGCCGDINCRLRATFEAAEEQGRALAAEVIAGDNEAPRSAEPPLAASAETLHLPLLPPPPEEEARALREQVATEAEASREGGNYGTRILHEGLTRWAGEILRLAEGGSTQRTVPFEVQALRVGDLGIVGLPGEVFVDYALHIAAASPLPLTAVAAYANGNIGYVPTAAAYPEGGYEVDSAIRFYGTTMPAPECEEMILLEAGRRLRELAR